MDSPALPAKRLPPSDGDHLTAATGQSKRPRKTSTGAVEAGNPLPVDLHFFQGYLLGLQRAFPTASEMRQHLERWSAVLQSFIQNPSSFEIQRQSFPDPIGHSEGGTNSNEKAAIQIVDRIRSTIEEWVVTRPRHQSSVAHSGPFAPRDTTQSSELPTRPALDSSRSMEKLQDLDSISSLSPSAFANDSNYYSNPSISHIRAQLTSGVPLPMMHTLFKDFYTPQVEQQHYSPEHTPESIVAASDVAESLISSMGEVFSNKQGGEKERLARFLTVIESLDLGPYETGYAFGNARIDAAWCFPTSSAAFPKGVPYILLEAKEGSTKGDVHVQLVRTYQIIVQQMEAAAEELWGDDSLHRFFAEGAPMFLVSLIGPDLVVWGGFFDGRNNMVQQLGHATYFTEDGYACHRDWRRTLLQTLLAFAHSAKGLRRLIDSFSSLPPAYGPQTKWLPSVPRLYTSWLSYSDPQQAQDQDLVTFLRPVKRKTGRLMFRGTVHTNVPVIIKMVDGDYEADVHQILASEQLAPKLIASSSVPSLPTAYAMEVLNISWQPLQDPAVCNRIRENDTLVASLREQLRKVLCILKEAQLAHGDLRPTNIMCRFDTEREKEQVSIRIIDFDWAGKVGEAKYPQERNEKIWWPGDPGQVIGAKDDGLMVAHWWERRFPTRQFSLSV